MILIIIQKYWKSIIWACLICFLSLSQTEKMPDTNWLNIPHKDKIVHFAMYFIFSFLLNYDHRNNEKTVKNSIYFIFIAIFYGLLMEFLQAQLSYRSADFFDFLANSFGAIAAMLFFIYFEKKLLDRY